MNYKLLDSCLISISAGEGKHPNEMKFSGVLVRVDEPSTKAPNGSKGHKILIPSALAKKQLHTLIGMGVNYSSDLHTHEPTRKVGVIQKAWLDGKNLRISGIIWKKDFPNAVKDLSKANLGMSFEASEISVEDEKADIWVLKTLCFTGATILYKTSAAYYNTSADAMAASAETAPARLVKIESRRKYMAKPNQKTRPGKKKINSAADPNEALVLAFSTALAPVVKTLKSIAQSQVNMQASIEALEASREEDDEDVDDAINAGEDGDDDGDDDIHADGEGLEDTTMTSKKKKVAAARKKKDEEDDDEDDKEDDDEDDDIDSEADDEDVLDDLGEDDDEDGDMPVGKMNKEGRTNKGRNPDGVEKKAGKPMSSSAQRTIAKLTASNEAQASRISKLEKEAKRNKRQLEAAAATTDRKTVSISTILASTIAKGGIDINSIHAAKEKVTVAEFDEILASQNLDTVTRVSLKNEMVRANLLEDGAVTSTASR